MAKIVLVKIMIVEITMLKMKDVYQKIMIMKVQKKSVRIYMKNQKRLWRLGQKHLQMNS